MSNAIDRLSLLRVKDVMAKDVVQIECHRTMFEAAKLFRQHDISSAPVVDETGHCVGILSATDFLKRESQRGEDVLQGLDSADHHLVRDSGMEPWHIEIDAEDAVAAHMTPAVQSIAPDATVIAAARMMCAQHVHRLLVVDAQGHPGGVVSSMDIVAALVNVVDEFNMLTSKD